ncbi:MAG: helix-turn-helix domain-containing protein [Lachnospiraceae bacterium]|nr:helix-turn-helix domain-containing protein [Lachnospiraceae bacterium]
MFEVDIELFRNVKVDAGGYGISWNDDLDLAAEDIWLDGIETGKRRKLEIALVFAEKLLQAREESGMTQKQLAERTGIYQADISKLERGQGNPSLSTIKRLAEAMDLQVRIEFERRK